MGSGISAIHKEYSRDDTVRICVTNRSQTDQHQKLSALSVREADFLEKAYQDMTNTAPEILSRP